MYIDLKWRNLYQLAYVVMYIFYISVSMELKWQKALGTICFCCIDRNKTKKREKERKNGSKQEFDIREQTQCTTCEKKI